MPTVLAITVSTGAMKNPASTRGTTSLPIGSVPSAQRVDLVGDDHRSEFGGDAGPMRPGASGPSAPAPIP